MQFQVPQFETENKLVGPFTIVQFAYVGVAVVISFLLFPVLTTWFWFIVSAILVGSSLVIALVKINGRSMPIFLLAAFRYLWEPKVLTLKFKVSGATGFKYIEPFSSAKKAGVAGQVFPAMPSVPAVLVPPFAPAEILHETPAPPVVSTTIPAVSAIPALETLAPIVPAPEKKRSRLQNLFNKITTTTSPIPFREESLRQAALKRQGYEFVEKPTGETVVARRVDYR
ncbi:MAG: hypothetical protein WC519_00950 [Parcubacteria group bacterium]